MAILPIDSGRYGTREMLAVFGEQRRIDCQVQVEGAVAAAQGNLGIIPRAAAREISRAARGGRITARRIAALERTTDHDTAALVQALAGRCAAHAGELIKVNRRVAPGPCPPAHGPPTRRSVRERLNAIIVPLPPPAAAW